MAGHLDQLRVFAEVSREMLVARELDELAHLVVERICSGIQCEVALLLRQSSPGEFKCWSASPEGLPDLLIPGLLAQVSQQDLPGRVFDSGRTIIVTESNSDTAGDAEERAIMAMPLKTNGDVLGVLQISGNFISASDDLQLPTFENFASHLAICVLHIQSQHNLLEQTSRLQTLQKLSRKITATLDLQELYQAIYHSILELMDCGSFFIALHDEKENALDYVFLMDDGIPASPQRRPLGEGMASYAIATRQVVKIPDIANEKRFQIIRWGGARRAMSALCVPMELADRVLGALSVQSYRPDAYDDLDLEILTIFAAQAAVAINNARLFAESQRKMEQLAVLNQVGHIVSSTIEIDRLYDLIYDQVRRIIAADSYYIALADLQEETLRVQVLVDEGKRYQPLPIQFGDGFAGLIAQQHTPFLVRSLDDPKRKGLIPKRMGEDRPSISYLGVPMMTSQHLVGVLAVGSYQPDAFNESDLEILQNIGTQAAIAIDNARHHAEVELEARLDSLTRVFNHGYFLKCLHEQVTNALRESKSLAVIMLDIDHFKEYNDTYGHLAGDAILRGTVQAIRANVEHTDLVGRWGGEEFAMALIGSDRKGARVVAERIRKTLAEMKMIDEQGRAIPVPTVSQGIAILMEDGQDPIALVDWADVKLYEAKKRGRDQISGV